MNFEGAVQVDRERIKKFLDVWKENSQWYDNRMDEIINKATKHFNQWWDEKSWLGKWWWDEYKNVSGMKVLLWWLKYEKDVRGTNSMFFSHNHLIYCLIELNEIPSLSRWDYLVLNKSMHSNIKNMYECGEPVYLSPSQARLVNEFIEMDPLEDVLKEWEKDKC